MSERRRVFAACVCVTTLVFAACSDAANEPADPGVVARPTEGEERRSSPRAGGRSDRREEDAGRDRRKRESSRGGNDEPGRRSATTNSGSGGGDDTSGGLAYPAAGTYVYRQSGFEEFCQTTSCDRRDLPPRQDVVTSYRDRSDSEAVLVSEARTSENRLARTTFRFTPEKALVTEVYTRFNYQNVRFEDTYRPDPPVEALRFPLTSGEAWSGRWKDKTSGEYEINVGARERVEAAGTTVDAFRIETNISFDGQFEGSSIATVWFDPRTKTIVRSRGRMDVRSAFGRYRTEFSTVLESGPGY